MARTGAALAIAVAFGAPSLASAQTPTIISNGLYLVSPTPIGATGGGLGNQTTILTLLNQGQQVTTTGCVTPGGVGSVATCGFADDDVQSGANTGTRFIAGLTGETLRLGFNATEPNTELSTTLNALQLTLYSGTTARARFDLQVPAGGLSLTNTLNGVGNFGFEFGLTAPAIQLFNSLLAAGNLSLGVGASVGNVAGGIETFNLATGAPQNGGGVGTVVPEPSTYLLLATGMGALGLVARRRRTNV